LGTDPFGGDERLQKLMLSLIDGGATAFVETGTWWGYTSTWVATLRPDTPVFTCDVKQEFLRGAAWQLPPTARLFNISGQHFVTLLASSVGDLPLFFFDAHWLPYWPIRDELRAVARLYSQAIMVVHDMYVPHCANYHYDVYNDLALDINLVHGAILAEPSHDYLIYFPKPPGLLAGYGVIFQDCEPRGLCLDDTEFIEWNGELS